MREQLAALAYLHIVVDEAVRTHFDIGSKHGPGMHGGKRMNYSHY